MSESPRTQGVTRIAFHTARSGENLMPRIIAAVEAYATLGEVADAMRRVFGEYSEAM